MKLSRAKYAYLGVLLCVLSRILPAETIQYQDKISPSHGAFVLIEHFSQGVRIDVNQTAALHNPNNKYAPLAPQLLIYPSINKTQTITLDISATPFVNEPIALNAKNIPATPQQVTGFQQLLVSLSHHTDDPRNKLKRKHFEQHYASLTLNESLNTYISYVLIDTYTNAGLWSDAWEFIAKYDKSPSRRIAMKCDFLSRFDIEQVGQEKETFLVAVGQLAYELIIYRRHHRDLSGESAGFLGEASYPALCESAIKKVAGLDSVDFPAFSERSWVEDAWPTVLFEYVLTKTHDLPAKNAAQLYQYVWLYFNFNDKHRKAAGVAKKGIDKLSNVAESYPRILAELYNGLFISLLRLGRFSEALKYTTEGLALTEYLNLESQWRMFFNPGFLHDYIGEFEIAEGYFQRALEVYAPTNLKLTDCPRIEGDEHQVGYAIAMLGSMARKLDNDKKAQSLLSCGLAKLEKIQSNHALVAHIELAKLALKQNNLASVLAHAMAVINNNTSLNAQMLDARVLYCKVTQLKSRYDDMEACVLKLADLLGYESLLDVPSSFPDIPEYPIRHVQLLQLLMEMYEGKGHKAQALEYADSALKLSEAYKYNLKNPQAWNSTRQGFIESYMGIVLGNDSIDLEKLPLLYALLEGPYSMEPVAERHTYSIAGEESCSNIELAAERAKQGSVSDTQRIQELNCMPYRDLKRERKVGIQDVQKRIPVDAAFLRYFYYQDSLHVLVISQSDAYVEILSSRTELSHFIQQTHDVFVEQYKPTQLARFHAKRLIPKKVIGKYHKLIIVPDGELEGLPFAALNTSEREGRYSPLVAELNVVLTSSASSYFSDVKENNKDFNLVLFGAPRIATDTQNDDVTRGDLLNQSAQEMRFPFLRGALREVESIAALFNQERVSVGVLEEATNQFLMSRQSRQASILHIATHGYLSDRSPNAVGIVSSTSDEQSSEHDLLSLVELLGYPMSNQLVVISGCDTQQGKLYRGSGIRSMTRGFLSQGAGAVIGTLWPIQDNSTAKFMTEFYRQLKVSGDSAEALRHTQLKFSRMGRYKAPKYWAGFVLNSSNHRYEQFSFH